MSDSILNGRSSIFGAMVWMFGLSFVLTLLLIWIPVVGPFIGPIVGGYVGGRRADDAGRAFLAAILPCVLMSLFFLFVGAAAAGLSHHVAFGGILALVGAVAGVALFFHNVVLMVAALVGGAVRSSETW